ncbi:MAG: protoheme IX farnesyltransferase [Alphaproteobacteria bacterium]|nr:protoheme IX farnesyltransferase [Alphaproteobacteria bacterium]
MSSAILSDTTPSSVRDFVTLLKPGVMSLVVFTGVAGMVVAPGSLHPFQQIMTLMCIAMGSGAGAAMNMWFDRDIDAIMKRTQNRPVPAGRVAPDDALAFGLFMAVASVMLMGLSTNWVSAGILAAAIAFYVLIYTMWLKRSTPQNIVIGGAAGAFPPMIGWAAVTGDVSLQSALLFAIIFLWTPPHFWALALYKCGDYAKAGVPMMPVVAGQKSTKNQMIFYTWLLLAATLALPALGMTGMVYGVSAAVLGVLFLFHVYKTRSDETEKWPRKTFGYSILYLFALFTALMLDSVL